MLMYFVKEIKKKKLKIVVNILFYSLKSHLKQLSNIPLIGSRVRQLDFYAG